MSIICQLLYKWNIPPSVVYYDTHLYNRVLHNLINYYYIVVSIIYSYQSMSLSIRRRGPIALYQLPSEWSRRLYRLVVWSVFNLCFSLFSDGLTCKEYHDQFASPLLWTRLWTSYFGWFLVLCMLMRPRYNLLHLGKVETSWGVWI